jgi:hypothetical protein
MQVLRGSLAGMGGVWSLQTQIPCGNDNKKDNGRGRFRAGMTEGEAKDREKSRKADATAH